MSFRLVNQQHGSRFDSEHSGCDDGSIPFPVRHLSDTEWRTAVSMSRQYLLVVGIFERDGQRPDPKQFVKLIKWRWRFGRSFFCFLHISTLNMTSDETSASILFGNQIKKDS